LSVIHPGLFLILRRFLDRKDDLRQMYRASKSFRSICQNYQKCSEALRYWAEAEHEQALDRQREYSALLHDLELEVIQSLNEGA
jgi:hypothetical protein